MTVLLLTRSLRDDTAIEIDNVLLYTGKAGIAAISHNGQSNLVNEIGTYNGRSPIVERAELHSDQG
ncbi:MAG: hypothetical protein M3Z84_10625 [Actinomycetota bacterium]|nr:hypothetical protein [Actinomycetota bacterium]